MKKILDKLAEIILEPVSKVIIILLGGYTSTWGLWVINPFIDTFGTSLMYDALYSIVPYEILWGLFALIFGLLTIVGVTKDSKPMEYSGAGALGAFWFSLSVLYFIGDLAHTGGITALFVSVISFYIYLNCKIQHLNQKSSGDC